MATGHRTPVLTTRSLRPLTWTLQAEEKLGTARALPVLKTDWNAGRSVNDASVSLLQLRMLFLPPAQMGSARAPAILRLLLQAAARSSLLLVQGAAAKELAWSEDGDITGREKDQPRARAGLRHTALLLARSSLAAQCLAATRPGGIGPLLLPSCESHRLPLTKLLRPKRRRGYDRIGMNDVKLAGNETA